jgi:hypothetical protein
MDSLRPPSVEQFLQNIKLHDLYSPDGELEDFQFAMLKKETDKSGGKALIVVHPFFYGEDVLRPTRQEYKNI